MEKELTKQLEAVQASQGGLLAVEQFLQNHYLFRRNVLSGKIEFATLPAKDEPAYRELSPEAEMSIILRARKELADEKCNPKTDIQDLLRSEEVRAYDPIGEFLGGLPQWDGQNHVARLFSRLPGLSTEQHHFLSVWLRSAVAHWLQMDILHGNECVPTLIGAQGCGKTTFVRRLLPQPLRQYYLDHLNLSNKFDKEMALTNNLIVNLDELDAIRPSQHPALKQTLSKSKVNGRPIFGRAQADRPRYASFVATTNNPHPLTDATGSRRYICLTIPDGQLIDNTGDIDYRQLYAQVLYELRELKAPYWFNNDEVARIQELNLDYMAKKDLTEMIEACFLKPEEGEAGRMMSNTEVLGILTKAFPSLKAVAGLGIKLGLAMKKLGFEQTHPHNVAHYRIVPKIKPSRNQEAA
jgi:predicted P-loop ATPase